jgi:hypothetical protein
MNDDYSSSGSSGPRSFSRSEDPKQKLKRFINDFINCKGVFADDRRAKKLAETITPIKKEKWRKENEIPRPFCEWLVEHKLLLQVPDLKEKRNLDNLFEILDPMSDASKYVIGRQLSSLNPCLPVDPTRKPGPERIRRIFSRLERLSMDR